MKYSLAFKCVTAALLVLTLASKFQVKPESSDYLRDRIVRFLQSQHFEVVESDDLLEGVPVFRANAGACRLLVMRASSLGWNRYMVEGMAEDGDRVFSVFEGKIYSEQPTWRSTISYRWSRMLRELGIREHASFVLAVVASSTCRVEDLPWQEISPPGDAGA